MACGIIGLAETLTTVDLEKGLAVLVCGAQLPPLRDDDRQRRNREAEQKNKDELDDQTGLENQTDQVEIHGGTPLPLSHDLTILSQSP